MKKLLLFLASHASLYSSECLFPNHDKLETFEHCLKHVHRTVRSWNNLAKHIGYDRDTFLELFPHNNLFCINKKKGINIHSVSAQKLYNEFTIEDFIILKNDFRLNNLLSNASFVTFFECVCSKLKIMYENYIEEKKIFKKYFNEEARKLAKKLAEEGKEKEIYNLLIREIIKILEKEKRQNKNSDKENDIIIRPFALIMQKDFITPSTTALVKTLIHMHDQKNILLIAQFEDQETQDIETTVLNKQKWHSFSWKYYTLQEIYSYDKYEHSAKTKLELIKHCLRKMYYLK